jgi:uncharacterized protein
MECSDWCQCYWKLIDHKQYIKYTLLFIFDLNKSRSNLEKHGIDFIRSQEIWSDVNRIEAPARNPGEKRFSVIGSISGDVRVAYITYRGEHVRVISVRRARKNE